MAVWILVLVLHEPAGRYVATRAFASEAVCQEVATEVQRQKPEVVAVCIEPKKVISSDSW